MAEHFAADWLALREPVDHRSRADHLVERFRAWRGEASPMSVLDLGAGTGSNLRYLGPRLRGGQSWTLADHDARLLHRLAMPDAPDLAVSTVVCDVTDEDALAALMRPEAGSPRPRLVTASALCDLVSEKWLDGLVRLIAGERAAVLFALSYDGAIGWEPTDSDDEVVRTAVNDHQRSDKGFGTALGPDAGAAIRAALQAEGYSVFAAATPWRLGSGEAELCRRLVDGWCGAATEQRPSAEAPFAEWRRRRLDAIDSGRFSLTVGHVDVLGLPPG